MSRVQTFDAVIIGSGPTGGFAAKSLASAGMNVLVLDAGRSRWQNDAIHSYDRTWRRLGYRIEEDPKAIRRQRVQSSCYAWPNHPHAFVDDIDNPYTTDADKPFAWIRSRQLGGRMAVRGHGLQFYRFSDLEFKCGDRDGASPSWPISYVDLAPYYDRIERSMRLRGACDGIPHLPDPVLAGETTLNSGERLLGNAVARRWQERRLIACRTASPPIPVLDAIATGRCTIRSNAIVSRVIVDPNAPRAKGVGFVDRPTGRAREVMANIVILCASSIESARLLLLSATRDCPEGLANSSGSVGRHLMDHTLVFIVGDHGEAFGELGLFGHDSTFDRYQTKTLCVANIPGETPRHIRRMTSHEDVPATILTYLGAENPLADYTQGLPLTTNATRPFVFIATWSAGAIVDTNTITSFGLEAYNTDTTVLDTNDVPLPHQLAALAAHRAELMAGLEAMRQFLK